MQKVGLKYNKIIINDKGVVYEWQWTSVTAFLMKWFQLSLEFDVKQHVFKSFISIKSI